MLPNVKITDGPESSNGFAGAINVPEAVPQEYALAVDIPQAARLLNLGVRTIRREIDRGHLRAVRIGRVWRIRTSELHAYLRRLEN